MAPTFNITETRKRMHSTREEATNSTMHALSRTRSTYLPTEGKAYRKRKKARLEAYREYQREKFTYFTFAEPPFASIQFETGTMKYLEKGNTPNDHFRGTEDATKGAFQVKERQRLSTMQRKFVGFNIQGSKGTGYAKGDWEIRDVFPTFIQTEFKGQKALSKEAKLRASTNLAKIKDSLPPYQRQVIYTDLGKEVQVTMADHEATQKDCKGLEAEIAKVLQSEQKLLEAFRTRYT